jgi:integrase
MRGRGEGALYKRPDGQWVASIELSPGPDGQRRRRVYYAPTRREALAKLDRVREEIKTGGRAPTARDRRITVAALLDEWLLLQERPQSRVKAHTLAEYRFAARTRVQPQLGSRRIADLDDVLLSEWQDHLLEEGYAPRSVLKARVILNGVIMLARRRKLLLSNPLELVQPPTTERPNKRALSGEEARRFLAALRGHRYETLILAALLTGNRRGEALAWRWSDVDLDAATVAIRAQVQRIPGVPGLQIVEPKTSAGTRVLPLPSFLVDALRVHQASQDPPSELVFGGPNGKPLEPRHFNRVFQQIVESAGLAPLTPHELRHSMATIMLGLGVPAVVVSQLLGHADASTTLRWYTHSVPEAHRAAMARMDAFVRRLDDENRSSSTESSTEDASLDPVPSSTASD